MITTFVYSMLALDQIARAARRAIRPWLYAILFAIIFAETGLVVFPFLPGDSILFISGTVVAIASLNVHMLVAVLIVAAILGDSVNYAVGHYIGPKVFHRARFALVQARVPRQDAGVLREVRRRHDHHRPVRADHPHVRAVPRRRGRNVVSAVSLLQHRRRGRVDRARSCTPATCSATSRGSRRT